MPRGEPAVSPDQLVSALDTGVVKLCQEWSGYAGVDEVARRPPFDGDTPDQIRLVAPVCPSPSRLPGGHGCVRLVALRASS